MPDELETCLAALFLNKGKDVLTAKELTMYVSLDLRWMQVKEAEALVGVLLDKGLVSRTGEYLRPLIDTSAVDVPVAYRPSAGFLRSLSGYAPKRTATGKPAAPQEAEAAAAPPDVLPLLIKAALESGMEKGAFVSECNKISKRADVDMEVAALMILRDRGADVAPFLAGVRASVLGR